MILRVYCALTRETNGNVKYYIAHVRERNNLTGHITQTLDVYVDV